MRFNPTTFDVKFKQIQSASRAIRALCIYQLWLLNDILCHIDYHDIYHFYTVYYDEFPFAKSTGLGETSDYLDCIKLAIHCLHFLSSCRLSIIDCFL